MCFFALMCAVCCSVAYHDVAAACMYVPMRGHHTNAMNVGVFQIFILFFLQRSLLSCHPFPEYVLIMTRLPQLSFCVSRWIDYMATVIALLIMDNFDH